MGTELVRGITPNFWYPFDAKFYWSPAVQSLTRKQMNLLMCLISELRFEKIMKKTKWLNNGHVGFTETMFVKKKLGSKNTYLKARNKLIEVGLIRQTYQGGMVKGNYSRYKILVPKRGVPEDEQRWRDYPEKNWKDDIPTAKNNKVGFDTRFKKKNSTPKLNGVKRFILPDKTGSKIIKPH